MPAEIIDLFCGVGGLTHGLLDAGLNVIAGFDIDPTCKYTYVHVLLGKHADTGNVVRNQTAHAGDSAVLTSMYSAMRRS